MSDAGKRLIAAAKEAGQIALRAHRDALEAERDALLLRNAALTAEGIALRAQNDALRAALIRARNYVHGPMIDRSGPMLREIDAALSTPPLAEPPH